MSPQITHQTGEEAFAVLCRDLSRQLENSVKRTLAATQAGRRRFPCTLQEGRTAKRTELGLKTPEAKAARAAATREADPVVPLHLNSILSGKSNKQNTFKLRSKYTIWGHFSFKNM